MIDLIIHNIIHEVISTVNEITLSNSPMIYKFHSI